MIDDDIARRSHIALQYGAEPFSILSRRVGLHPAVHWRGSDLRDVDFGEDDLKGFDFSRADLRGANLSKVRNLRAEMFVDCLLDHRTGLPDDLRAAIWPPRRPLLPWREPIPGLPEAAWPDMVTLPAGVFTMGAPKDEEGSDDDERPQRPVTVPRPFALGRVAVNFAQWDAAVAAGFVPPEGAKRPSDRRWGRKLRPVINVSWDDAQAYCTWLNERLGLPTETYRLPSEAEWEYACRAGTTTPFSFGATISPSQVNYDGNFTYGEGDKGEYRERTVPVGSLPANDWGLHEMHGNVWEWCEDAFGDYPDHPTDSRPLTPSYSSLRVLRGGSWDVIPSYCRSAYRNGGGPEDRSDDVGFRLARTLF